jgi:TolB-like protein
MLERASNGSDEPLKPTIALLPFTMAAPDPQLRTIASQARDSLANTFSESGLPLRVLNFPSQGGTRPADFLLSGDLSRTGDKIVATVRLDDAAHSVTVYTHQIEAGQADVRDLAERIGAQVASSLTGKDTMLILDRRHPLDPTIMAGLLAGSYLKSDPLQTYQQAKRAAAKVPDAQSTQIALAYNAAFALSELPRDEREQALAEARQAADRAIALGPRFGDAYSTWCVLHSEALVTECEDRLRAAKRIDPDAPWANTFLSHLLRGVGRIDEATQLARLSQTHDVYVPQKIAWLLRVLEYSGDRDEAQGLYEQGVRWWPEFKPMLFRNRVFGLIDRGDFQAIQQLEESEDASKLWPGWQSTGPLVAALNSRSITAARLACPSTAKVLLKVQCMLVFARLGNLNDAYAIADELYPRRLGRTPAETERIWLDDPDGPDPEFITSSAAAPMRRDPRYVALTERVGLLAYWRSGRPPDFCRMNPEPVCSQLLPHH